MDTKLKYSISRACAVIIMGISGACLQADTSSTVFLTVTDVEERMMTFMVNEELKVTVSGDTLLICRPYDRREVMIEDIRDIRHEPGLLVSQERVRDSHPVLRIQDDAIVISGYDTLAGGRKDYHIYDMTGKLVCSGEIKPVMKVALSGFEPGVYAMRIDGCPALKFLVR